MKWMWWGLMADNTLNERLQPSLLDRLTDQEPHNKTETREARVISVTRLREIIRRDLAFLLNSNNLETVLDETTHPNVCRSVLNYGVRDTSGDFGTTNRAEEIRKSIETAILRFEPRIVPGTLNVVLATAETKGKAMVDFDIQADMWAQPMPMELYLRSRVDITTGELWLDSKI